MKKTVFPLVLYGIKVLAEKYGSIGIRVDAGIIYEQGRWKHHVVVGKYETPCNCVKGVLHEA